jgi:DNA-binding GntR family transcriptional regulator
MDVSQAPVREALRLLQAAGLVSPPNKKGIIVNKLSSENLREISELRILLELLAGRDAVDLINRKTLINLESLHQKYVKYVNRNDVEQALELNKQFHHTLYASANKPILLSIIEGLWDKMSPYLHLLFKAVSTYNLRETIVNHQLILDGLKDGNKKKVTQALEKDLETARNYILNFFTESD